jgi:WD40 repeat protein
MKGIFMLLLFSGFGLSCAMSFTRARDMGPYAEVTTMAFSPDSRYLLTGYNGDRNLQPGPEDRDSITLWDVQAGKEVKTWKGHSREVTFVAFLPDGKQAVSAAVDGSIRLWDVAKGVELRALTFDEGNLSKAALTNNGKSILYVGLKEDRIYGTIKLLDIASSKVSKPFERLGERHGLKAASPNGVVALWVGGPIAEKRLDFVFWDMTRGCEIKRMKADWQLSNSIFTSDGKYFVAEADHNATREGYLAFWEVSTCTLAKKLKGYEKGTHEITVTPDNKRLIAVCGDGQMKCWDLSTDKVAWSTTAESLKCTVSPDGKWVASSKGRITRGKTDLVVEIRDVATGQQLKTMEPANRSKKD